MLLLILSLLLSSSLSSKLTWDLYLIKPILTNLTNLSAILNNITVLLLTLSLNIVRCRSIYGVNMVLHKNEVDVYIDKTSTFDSFLEIY